MDKVTVSNGTRKTARTRDRVRGAARYLARYLAATELSARCYRCYRARARRPCCGSTRQGSRTPAGVVDRELVDRELVSELLMNAVVPWST
eukprot:3184667-Rhodomonas_salina.1